MRTVANYLVDTGHVTQLTLRQIPEAAACVLPHRHHCPACSLDERRPTIRSRTGLGPESPASGTGSPGGLSGKHRLVIAAGIVAALIVSVVSAALAGAFSSATPAAAASEPSGHAVATRGGAAAAPQRAKPTPGGTPAVKPATGAGLTSCTSVAHIGDSTSVGMVSPASLPSRSQRLRAQYRDVGVRHALIDASGGRSIVEEMPGQLNGYRVATDWFSQGFRGCWVFALGTNDTANVAVGSNVGLAARIQEMMSAAHGEPVMWVNTQTDLTSGPWSEANMQLWNNALVAACKSYPNMRIFNWAAMVRPEWHLDDGIHYTSQGYAIRAHAIARALARAFPADGHSSQCVVN
ncbi:MAG TPA: SGNH/GDSL hydrolase family protein [Streptosporangiaceae bacterium]|nr:SGNH/GDSL hydrolase family protein [Streptosporangiaceae bacterium]